MEQEESTKSSGSREIEVKQLDSLESLDIKHEEENPCLLRVPQAEQKPADRFIPMRFDADNQVDQFEHEKNMITY